MRFAAPLFYAVGLADISFAGPRLAPSETLF
jgi:hypothetical protein